MHGTAGCSWNKDNHIKINVRPSNICSTSEILFVDILDPKSILECSQHSRSVPRIATSASDRLFSVATSMLHLELTAGSDSLR